LHSFFIQNFVNNINTLLATTKAFLNDCAETLPLVGAKVPLLSDTGYEVSTESQT